jgi:hypothetical protein
MHFPLTMYVASVTLTCVDYSMNSPVILTSSYPVCANETFLGTDKMHSCTLNDFVMFCRERVEQHELFQKETTVAISATQFQLLDTGRQVITATRTDTLSAGCWCITNQ